MPYYSIGHWVSQPGAVPQQSAGKAAVSIHSFIGESCKENLVAREENSWFRGGWEVEKLDGWDLHYSLKPRNKECSIERPSLLSITAPIAHKILGLAERNTILLNLPTEPTT